ncbi:metalloregulator ArsR/SmtB family transcription factor [Chloroflexota bacterium]
MKKKVQEPLLWMFKALADESRLIMLRVLHEHEYSVGDLAERVGLAESTVSHHLSRLREAGFVKLRMAGNQRLYRSNPSGIAKFKKLAADLEQMPVQPEPRISDNRWIAELGWSEEDQQVLLSHTMSGQLTRLPTKQKKLLVILRWLVTLFEPDRFYTEREVNEVLQTVHTDDYVGLRRDLVDFGYLRRERGGGKYWLAPADEKIPNQQQAHSSR